jgi:hypothetical protein
MIRVIYALKLSGAKSDVSDDVNIMRASIHHSIHCSYSYIHNHSDMYFYKLIIYLRLYYQYYLRILSIVEPVIVNYRVLRTKRPISI